MYIFLFSYYCFDWTRCNLFCPDVVYKIIRRVHDLSLVNRCVEVRVCEHGCEITRILIGNVLSDECFDWLVGKMSAYQENLF